MFALFSRLKRVLLIVLGFLLIAVFIWYAGPYFAFADFRPLESETARLILIALVIGCWVVSALLRRLRAYRASDKLLAAVIAQPQPEPTRSSAEALKLRERFEEAVATLKQQRREGQSLYDLPWYVIIGAPGSGKTTALLNSGLKFPLEQRVGKGALRGVGGTRNCDWWFTNEAVFLDTAGRYTTQDSDAASDSAGWGEFLALLRKYRARRPVNGVILTINAQDLMVQGDVAREAHVEAASRRLSELNRELRIQLPVYLMVTKCDLVAGFTEYFDDLAQEGRAQVWGVTFPYDQTLKSEAAQLFPAEFDALMARLNERVFGRVEEVRDVRRRTRIFAFPQQMAGLRDALTHFVSEVFASTHFDEQVLLRGVYFTSGTQDGTPIDRLLGVIGRRFGVAAEAVAPASGPGKAYFVERLLKEVMIGESGLAGVNRRLEARKAAVQLGAYAAMALVAVLGVIALTVSYSRNRSYLSQTAADIAAFHKLPTVPGAAPLERVLPRLDAMRAVVDSADRYRDDTPWTMRWGLYRGGSVGSSARDAYVRELDGMLLPRVAARIKARLAEYSTEPNKLYLYLKAYLMLGDPKRLDKKHLQYLADLEWKTPNETPSETGTALSQHFQNLLDYSDTLRPIALDQSLVAQARISVRQASLPQIMYGNVKSAYAGDRARALRIDTLAGVGAEQVFRRKSGVKLSEPMPGLYAASVFKEITTGQGRAALLKLLAQDDWVWGEGGVSAANAAKVVVSVTNLYEQDYIRAWDALLDDLEFVSFPTVSQTSEALRIITGPTSPLRGLLRVVVDNTSLVASDSGAPSSMLSSAQKKLSEGLGRIQQAVGLPTVSPGTLITAHFQPIRQLMAGEPGKAPIDGILQVIADIQQQLATLGPGVADSNPLGILSSSEFRSLLRSLEQQAAPLPPGLRTLIAGIGNTTQGDVIAGATGEVEQRYRQEVVPACRQLVEGRYPFSNNDNKREMTLAEFGTVFGYEGLFDKFLTDNMLDKQIDMSGPQWGLLPGSVRLSQSVLDQFQAARRLRDMFFTKGSQTPALAFSVTLGNLDPTAKRFVLRIDGQISEATPGAAKLFQLKWPGPISGEAVATFEERYLDPPTVTHSGPWAWFRLIDDTVQPSTDPRRTLLHVRGAFHQVQITVEPSSALNNPFATRDWRQFSCGSS
jgi:type VI secretion system protein ImpL